MAEEGPKVSFEGDTSGVEAAAKRTMGIIDAMRAKLQQQNGALNGFANMWKTAFSIPSDGGGSIKFLDNIGTKADQAGQRVGGLSKELQRLGTGAGIGLLAKETADMADVWTRTRNLLAATGVSTSELASRQSELVEMAVRTRTALEPTVSLYSRMYRALTPLGAAEADVAKAVEITNMAFKAGGAAVSEQNAAILQLSQSLGSGILQGDELRSVRENAPLIAKAIADEFGVSIAGLKKLGSEGKLTTERVFKGILDGGEEIEKQFNRTTATIGDSFNNLRTRVVEYIGNANEATGASRLLGGVINLVANNIAILIDAMIVAAAVMGANLARGAIASMIASLKLMGAQLRISAIMFQETRNASVAASYGMAMATSATTGLRAALAALMGPIGIVIALGAAIGAVVTSNEQAEEATRKWREEIDETVTSLEALDAKIQEVEERKLGEKIGDFGDINGQIETAAQRVDRLKKSAQEVSAKKFGDDMAKANTIISDLETKVSDLTKLVAYMQEMGKTDTDGFFNMKASLDMLKVKLNEAIALKNRLQGVGPENYDEGSRKEVIQAIYDQYEVEEFQARNNSAKLIEILTRKVQTAKQLYGDESEEYMRAVNAKEKAEEEAARSAKERANERKRQERDAQKDAIESIDTRLEAAEDDKEQSYLIMEEKLAMLKRFYGEDSREYQRGLQEQIRMKRSFLNQENAMARERLSLSQDIALGEAQVAYDATRDGLEQKRALIQQAQNLGRIDAVQAAQFEGQLREQEIQAQISYELRLMTIKRDALQAQLQMEGLLPAERQRILNQLILLENDYNQRIAGLRNKSSTNAQQTQIQVANAVADSWKGVLSPVGNSISGMFQNLYNGTMGWKDAFLNVLDQMLFAFIDFAIQQGVQWAAMELAKTSATTAGVAARTAAETAGAATSQAISAQAAIGQILNYGWTAAAAAYSAVAGIPVIGPYLAVGVSAAALAAVLGMVGNILSAEGGLGEVPADGTITELHKQEMVLPAKFANPLRNMLTGSVGMPLTPGTVSATAGQRADYFRQNNTQIKQGDTNLTYAPQNNVNNVRLETLLRRDGLAMRKWMMNWSRNQPNGGRPKKSA